MPSGPQRLAQLLTRAAAGLLARLAARLERLDRALATPASRNADQRSAIAAAMGAHDMVEEPDEAYYRDRYVAWIEAGIRETGADLAGEHLDAGCGSGRLTLPLARLAAERGGNVLAVDFLPDLLEAGRRRADLAGLGNVRFEQGELPAWLRDQPADRYGVVLFLEAGYVIPQLEETLAELRRVMRPGGVLFTGFRPRWFLALLGAQRRDWELTDALLDGTGGVLPGLNWQNWHDASDARDALERAGLEDVRLRGLGAVSGIEGDPLGELVRPGAMSGDDRTRLARVEDALAEAQPDVGR